MKLTLSLFNNGALCLANQPPVLSLLLPTTGMNFLTLALTSVQYFFDFRKAFDTVPHRPLLQKLFDLSVHPLILRWLTHYLSSRSQYDCVNGASSDILPVASGVPQGSVLGPLLFIIYVNNITTVPLSAGSMTLYADDILLFRPISTSSDFHFLKEDINNRCF